MVEQHSEPSRTVYVVVRQHGMTRQFWTGMGWSSEERAARTFEFMTDAVMRAYLECDVEPAEWKVEPVFRGEERVAS